jgi:polyisoprenoid-binding protein YceI
MKTGTARTTLIVLVLAVALARGGTSKHAAVKDKSSMTYVLIHPLHRIEGVSHDVNCAIEYDDATHAITHATFSADVSSFDSGNSNRDSHAMEILEALLYPTVSFESSSIVADGSSLKVTGDLTFHGTTKSVAFSAIEKDSSGTMNISGGANISLTAFNIERPSLLMIPVQDTLSISFTVVFPMQ